MFCSVCGNNYDDSVAFCPICGAANNSVAPQSTEATPVDEPTVGNFDSIPPVAPQPVEAPVAVATVVSQPVEAPVVPQPEYQAPVEAQPMVNDAQASFVASVPQAEITAPVGAQVSAPAPAKKSKKPIIIGVVAALLVAAIVAVVLLFVVPKFGNKSDSETAKKDEAKTATYEVDSPLGDISAALQKTLFENSGMEFSIITDYDELHGAIGIGDSGKESGFYCIDSDGYGYGFAEYLAYTSYGGESPMPDDYTEMLREYGLDVDIEEILDDVLNNKIDLAVVEKLYNDSRSDIEAMLEEKMGESITLPEFDEIQQFFADFVNEGLTEEAISITESKDGDNTEYEYEINVAELAKCAYEYAKDDSKAEGILTLLGMVFGGSGSDYIGIIGEMIDYYEYELDFEIEGEIVVNKDGYITKLEVDLFGDEVVIELKNFNEVEVTLDVLEEKIEIMEYEDEYYDDYYEDDYYEDEYYDDYGEAFIDAEYYDLYLYEGETTSLLIECWGSDLPDYYTFYVEYPDCVSVYWGGWETDTSNRLYVTGEYAGDGYMTVYLRDESNNNIDYIDIYVCVE